MIDASQAVSLQRTRPPLGASGLASREIPPRGARIERVERGTVFYSDQLQILVKWDDGRSQSLRTGIDRFRVVGP
jgi:hypothetical protein